MKVMAKKKPNPAFTPARIRSIREARGLTIEQAAKKVGVKPRTWHSWELPSQDRIPSPSHEILIRLLEQNTI